MDILVAGASTPKSIGRAIGQAAELDGHSVTYLSRNPRADHVQVADITKALDVDLVFKGMSPDVVVHAAGIYTNAAHLGWMSSRGDLRKIKVHLAAKTMGAYLLLNAAARANAQYFIALGGRAVSSEPGYAWYTAGTGALWSLVEFANLHSNLKAYFIDLPLVAGSAMGEQFRADESMSRDYTGMIKMSQVTDATTKILKGEVEPGRIILGEGWTK
ncbi:MAG TPA: NAD-dependent epimerase/dehydratase family protein [Candidatus Paceibacterota bacterium]|jgi:NAD(P)-dependent dehydrogenase (short-subunit alcohol dehydrogenase family)|nr:NAD-dependent epimerase/dehydratase family protein [Candidatus Paceibacterota bacterium]